MSLERQLHLIITKEVVDEEEVAPPVSMTVVQVVHYVWYEHTMRSQVLVQGHQEHHAKHVRWEQSGIYTELKC